MLQLFLLKNQVVSFQSKAFLTQPAIHVTLSDGCNQTLLILLCISNGAWINSSLCFPHVCTCLDLKEGISTHPRYFCQKCHITSNMPVNVLIFESHGHSHCGLSLCCHFMGICKCLLRNMIWGQQKKISHHKSAIVSSSSMKYVQHREPQWRRALCLENNSSTYKTYKHAKVCAHVSTQS